MEYAYIFDYSTGDIYGVEIPEKFEDLEVEQYLIN